MRAAFCARLVFGASAVLYGVIALMWHDADTWQTLREIWRLPWGAVIGAALMIAQIAGGLALPHPRTSRWGSIVLGVVYGLFSLACIPDIIAAPAVYVYYGSFFEQFTLACGAVAVYAATGTHPPRSALLGGAARFGLGLCAVSFTLSQAIYFHLTAGLVPAWIAPSQSFWALLTTIAFGLAAVAILTNLQAQLATRLMTLMLALFGVLVWIPLVFAHPQTHLNWSEFALTFLITGAAWTVAESFAIGYTRLASSVGWTPGT